METIAFAYGDDWEKALAMDADKDYEVRYVDCYDPGDHRVLAGTTSYKTGLGALVFVKVKTLRHLH
jgi:hypothetical protein